MLGSKRLDVWQPVRHLAADRIEILEPNSLRDTTPGFRPPLSREAVQRLGRLREEADIPVKIQPVEILHLLDNNSSAFRLPDQAVHLACPFFP